MQFLARLLFTVICSLFLSSGVAAAVPPNNDPIVFAERDGMVAVEAEHFFSQTRTEKRAFHLVAADHVPNIRPDGDPPHLAGASHGGYLEILPDTRRTHGDKLIRGTNFSPEPGKMAIVGYKVHFQNPGRYYVWVRAYSTGSEDNGLHVGIDGTWPESGQRLQWCKGKHTWRWESKQRTQEEHCGEPYKIYLDVKEPGEHTIHFSMREDGFEFDKWLMTQDREFPRPESTGPESQVYQGKLPKPFHTIAAAVTATNQETLVDDRSTSPTTPVSNAPLVMPRRPDGDASVTVTGEQQVWHKITLSLDGPYAHEQDNAPNPFTDYRMIVQFHHGDGTHYTVPGYFAADGNAAESSAEFGTTWRAHFAPDRAGEWAYRVEFKRGDLAALDLEASSEEFKPFHGRAGLLNVQPSNKTGRDLRAHGRLQYVGKHYLRFAGSGKYFLKAGADAPETLLAYQDFDNTIAGKPKKSPLKTWQPHVRDWQSGDPTWQGGKGKGLIGAVNYLSGKGCNAFSFLTYNAGGDGDNVWPFIHRDDKLHYDCSKLDQWGIVFDHGTQKGMYLHFKMQETENDDHTRHRSDAKVPESLDGGNLGVQRKLYCKELIARFGHNLALNWNLGEENTQTHEQQQAMIQYIADRDPYDHNIVVHTFPEQQDKVYKPKLGSNSKLTGLSLQNSNINTTHEQTLKWVTASAESGRPWVVAFDESGSAAHGQCPDLGYRGFDGRDRTGKMIYTEHEVRQRTLWGTLMAGGAGCEYYFGYQFAENDLVCEDWRSRDRSWDYCRIAIECFHDQSIPFWDMKNANGLIGNAKNSINKFCFAKPGEIYLVYLANGGSSELDLTGVEGTFSVSWFDPRQVGPVTAGSVESVTAGSSVGLGQPPANQDKDWLVIVRRR